MAEFDFSELTELAADIESAPGKLPRYLRKAVEVTARNVKDGARERVSRRKGFSQAAGAINYDVEDVSNGLTTGGVDAEIGYNKHWRAGRLGNLIEFGAPGSTNRLPPGGELQDALHEQRGDFETGIERAVDDALKAAGL